MFKININIYTYIHISFFTPTKKHNENRETNFIGQPVSHIQFQPNLLNCLRQNLNIICHGPI